MSKNDLEMLYSDDSSESPQYQRPRDSRKGFWLSTAFFWLVVNSLFLACNLFILFREHAVGEATGFIDVPYSPAQEHVRYVIKTDDDHHMNSQFTGKPSPAVDQAWNKLLRGTMLRLTEEEMFRMNMTSIKIQGGGYVGYLEAYHQLHCVKRMYQSQYPEYYSDVVAKGKLTGPHFDHCIEVLRRGIMCNADISLKTLAWDPQNTTELLSDYSSPQRCVDWNFLESFTDERTIFTHKELLVPFGDDSMGPGELL